MDVQVTPDIDRWTARCQAQALKLIRHCLIGCVIPACFVHAQETLPGFLYTQGTFQTLSYPGSTSTTAADINNLGQIAGSFRMGGASQAFVLSGNTYTPLDVFGYASEAYGINDHGAVVGGFYDNSSSFRSFLYQDGAYSEVTIPNVSSVAVFGINNSGLMSGFYSTSPGSGYHGFIGDGEHFTTIDVPGAGGTLAYGLNDLGQVVGRFANSSGGQSGFIYDSDSDAYTIFDVPGSNFTNPFGINNLGQVTGYYDGDDGQQGFLMSDFNFSDIRIPSSYEDGTTFTVPHGINDLGQIVGYYADVAPVTEVPDPEVLWLFLVVLLGLKLRLKQQRRCDSASQLAACRRGR